MMVDTMLQWCQINNTLHWNKVKVIKNIIYFSHNFCEKIMIRDQHRSKNSFSNKHYLLKIFKL